jgi:hypothetical protein
MQSHSVCTRGVHVVRHEAQGEQSLKHRVHVGKIGIDAILRGAVVSFPLVDAHLVLLDQSLPLPRFAIASFQAASCACACACAAEGRGNVVIHRVIDQFQVDDNEHVGRPCEVSLAPPYPELFASYASNKNAASAYGKGAGGLAVDAMVIGCLGVERRGRRFLVLGHFFSSSEHHGSL